MTQSQEAELETLFYFWPDLYKIKITEADKERYFEWSEQGKHKNEIQRSGFTDGFNALVSAKQWRGRTIHELYEPGVLSGDVPYATLIENAPRSVIDFMKKEMFKGNDANVIEAIYSAPDNLLETLWLLNYNERRLTS